MQQSYMNEASVYYPLDITKLANRYLGDKKLKRKVLLICQGRKNQGSEEKRTALTVDISPTLNPHILADIEHPDFADVFPENKFDLIIALCSRITDVMITNFFRLLKRNGKLLARHVADPRFSMKERIVEGTYEGHKLPDIHLTLFQPRLDNIGKPLAQHVISRRTIREFLAYVFDERVSDTSLQVILKFYDVKDINTTREEKQWRKIRKILAREDLDEKIDDLEFELEFSGIKVSLDPHSWRKEASGELNKLRGKRLGSRFSTYFDQFNALMEKHPGGMKKVVEQDPLLLFEMEKSYLELKKDYESLDKEQKMILRDQWREFDSLVREMRSIYQRIRRGKIEEEYRERKEKEEEKSKRGEKRKVKNLRGIDLSEYPSSEEMKLGFSVDDDRIFLSWVGERSESVCVECYSLFLKETYDNEEIESEWEESFLGGLISMIERCEQDYLVIMLTLTLALGGSHANVLIVDIRDKKIERFEPNGLAFVASEVFDDLIPNILLKDLFLARFKYVPAVDICPFLGLQSKQKHFKGEEGFCASWAHFFIELKTLNLWLLTEEIQDLLLNLTEDELLSVVQKYTTRLRGVVDKIKVGERVTETNYFTGDELVKF